jgi:hypothetical protein
MPLNPVQRTFHMLGRLVNPNSCDLLVVDGRPDAARLEQALQLAVAQHPLCGATLDGNTWVVPGLPPKVPLLRLEVPEEQAWDQVQRCTWGKKFEERGPFLRACLICSPRYSRLVVVSSHAITDARSGAILMNDWLHFYGELEAGRRPTVAPVDVPDRSMDLYLGKKTRWQKLSLFGQAIRNVAAGLWSRGGGIDASTSEPGNTGVYVQDLGEDVLSRGLAAARAQGVTLHALLLLCLTRGVAQKIPGRPLRILDLHTLRPFAQAPVDGLFDVLVTPHSLELDPAQSDSEILDNIHRRLTELKQGAVLSELYRLWIYTSLARVFPFTIASQFVFKYLTRTDLVTTNPGVVPFSFERLGSLPVVDFLNFPQLGPPAKLGLIFTTFRRRLRLIVLYDRTALPDGGQQWVQPLLAELEARLPLEEQRSAG